MDMNNATPDQSVVVRNLDLYAEWTDRTAQYPINAEPYYLAMGAIDEAGEMTEKLAAGPTIVRDDLLAELGDVCWYLARYVYRVHGESVTALLAVSRTAFASDMVNSDVLFIALAKIVGVEKKRVRDGHTWDVAKLEAKNALALQQAGRAFLCIERFAEAIDATLLDVCDENVKKLTSRKAAGTIAGDGDKR